MNLLTLLSIILDAVAEIGQRYFLPAAQVGAVSTDRGGSDAPLVRDRRSAFVRRLGVAAQENTG